MKFYYDITVVNMTERHGKSVPVTLDTNYDCQYGENRVQVVNKAVAIGSLKAEDVQYICEVENMLYKDYLELLEFNANNL